MASCCKIKNKTKSLLETVAGVSQNIFICVARTRRNNRFSSQTDLGLAGEIHIFFLSSNFRLFCFLRLFLFQQRLLGHLLVSLQPPGIRVAAGGEMGRLSAFLSCRFVACLPR